MNGNILNAGLLEEIPKRFPGIRLWRSNRIRTMAVGAGGKPRLIDAGIDGQGDLSGIVAPSGRRLEIETKAGKDRLRPAQTAFRNMILQRGGIYIVARTIEDGLALLEWNLRPEEKL